VKIGVLKESRQGETRVSITPLVVQNLLKMGFEVNVEAGAGLGAHYSDAVYSEAGAQVLSRADVYASDVMVQVNIPDAQTKEGISLHLKNSHNKKTHLNPTKT